MHQEGLEKDLIFRTIYFVQQSLIVSHISFHWAMELEIRNGVDPVAFELNLNVNKENEVTDDSTDALQVNNGVPEDKPLIDEGLNSSEVGNEVTTAVAPESKVSTVSKVIFTGFSFCTFSLSSNYEERIIKMKLLLFRRVGLQRCKRMEGAEMGRLG